MALDVNMVASGLLDELTQEAKGSWSSPNSKYIRVKRDLSIDKRGSFGERFFASVLTTAYPRRINIEYKDGDQGDWDIKLNGHKFEIKTSTIDVNNRFQNEGIKETEDYYGILFLCVTPERLYVKFVKKSDIDFAKLHNRGARGTGRGYKWDFKIADLVEIQNTDDVKKLFDVTFPDILK
jgi:hypothetical protein